MSKRNPFGYSCPKCGGVEINISAFLPCTVRLCAGKFNGDGYDVEQTDGAQWEDDDGASCIGCGWDGPVGKLIYDGKDVDDEDIEEDENDPEEDCELIAAGDYHYFNGGVTK